MTQKTNKPSFKCKNCSLSVPYESFGTKNRNHCPKCLYSLHLDGAVGDRKSNCQGSMGAIGKMYKEDGEEVLVHKCEKCGFVRKNRVAGDDSVYEINKLPKVDSL